MSDYAPWDDDGVYQYDEAEFERATAECEEAEERLLAELYPLMEGFEEYNTETVVLLSRFQWILRFSSYYRRFFLSKLLE